jgi:hypothetical protein
MLTDRSEFWKQNLTMTNGITVNNNNNNNGYYNCTDV